MKKILALFLGLILSNLLVFAENLPYIEGSFQTNSNGIYAAGYLKTTNRYIKSAILECNYEQNNAVLYTATYVNNGVLRPSLYPTKQTYDIIEKTNNKIILKAHNNAYLIIDLKNKTIKDIDNGFILYTNQEDIEKELIRI